MLGLSSKFCIIYNSLIPEYKNALEALEKTLNERSIVFDKFDIDELEFHNGADFVFVIGGDGTILRVAKFFAPYETPVFGLNIGRLGFLSQTNEQDVSYAIDKILKNEFKVEKRLMLQSNDLLALNDFVVKGVSNSRTSKFCLKLNDKFVCEYIADGLIISTPTGYTAYGLSAGGPVLHPMLDVILIVAICPHTLSARPLVIPAKEKISIVSCDVDLPFSLAIDGDEAGEFSSEICIEKSPLCAHLALLDDEFYNVLRSKFHWGVAPNK